MDCLFCAVAAGDIPAQIVWEDDHVMAFMDIGPLADGHTLIIPKAHAKRLEDASPQDQAAVVQAAARLLPFIKDAVGAPDATLAIHDGPAAGQEVPHLHLHVVPRRPGDAAGPIHALFDKRASSDPDHIAAIAAKIRPLAEA